MLSFSAHIALTNVSISFKKVQNSKQKEATNDNILVFENVLTVGIAHCIWFIKCEFWKGLFKVPITVTHSLKC